ncbi:MAG: hypothetical protein ABIQ40_09285 [Bacteroidia bacterium]
MKIDFDEQFNSGNGDNETTKEYKPGTVKMTGFAIKAGEKKVYFTIPFSYSKSASESMADKGGSMGGIGKMSGFMKGENQNSH